MEGNIDFSDCDEELLLRSVNETMSKYNEFSDCDEELLFRSAEEIESAYIQSFKKPMQNRKRKLDVRGDDQESKKSKVENALFSCDICERNYKRKNDFSTSRENALLQLSNFKMQTLVHATRYNETTRKKVQGIIGKEKKHSFANTVTYHFRMI